MRLFFIWADHWSPSPCLYPQLKAVHEQLAALSQAPVSKPKKKKEKKDKDKKKKDNKLNKGKLEDDKKAKAVQPAKQPQQKKAPARKANSTVPGNRFELYLFCISSSCEQIYQIFLVKCQVLISVGVKFVFMIHPCSLFNQASQEGSKRRARLRVGGRRRGSAHDVRREAAAESGHQQTARREAGPCGAHHPVPRALAARLQPRRDRDRLWDTQTFHPAWARAIRQNLFTEETKETFT